MPNSEFAATRMVSDTSQAGAAAALAILLFLGTANSSEHASTVSALTQYGWDTSAFSAASLSESELASRFDDAIDELRRLSGYHSGWNGPRSLAANTKSFTLAELFIRSLPEDSRVASIDPTIFSTGNAILELVGDDRELTIEFFDDGQMSVTADTADGPLDFDFTDFDGMDIPTELARIL